MWYSHWWIGYHWKMTEVIFRNQFDSLVPRNCCRKWYTDVINIRCIILCFCYMLLLFQKLFNRNNKTKNEAKPKPKFVSRVFEFHQFVSPVISSFKWFSVITFAVHFSSFIYLVIHNKVRFGFNFFFFWFFICLILLDLP